MNDVSEPTNGHETTLRAHAAGALFQNEQLSLLVGS
jgi:hypothetical protein